MAEPVRAGGTVSSDILSRSPLAEPVRAEGSVSSDILSHSLLAEAARAGGTISSDIFSRSPLAEAVRAGGTVSSDILSHSPLAEPARAGGTSLFGNPVRDAGACRDCASPSRQRAGGTPLRYFIVEKFVLATRCGYLYQKMR